MLILIFDECVKFPGMLCENVIMFATVNCVITEIFLNRVEFKDKLAFKVYSKLFKLHYAIKT